MQATTDLTSTRWQVADAIARQLVLDDAEGPIGEVPQPTIQSEWEAKIQEVDLTYAAN